MRTVFVVLAVFALFFNLNGQDLGKVKGKVIDKQTREALPFVNLIIQGTTIGTTTNELGEFVVKNVPLGYVKITASFVGYNTATSSDYLVTKDKSPFVLFELEASDA